MLNRGPVLSYFKPQLLFSLELYLDMINYILIKGLYTTFLGLDETLTFRLHTYFYSSRSIPTHKFEKADFIFSYNIYTFEPPTLNRG